MWKFFSPRTVELLTSLTDTGLTRKVFLSSSAPGVLRYQHAKCGLQGTSCFHANAASSPTSQPTDWLTALPEPQKPLAGWETNNLHLVVQGHSSTKLILSRTVERHEKFGHFTYFLMEMWHKKPSLKEQLHDLDIGSASLNFRKQFQKANKGCPWFIFLSSSLGS